MLIATYNISNISLSVTNTYSSLSVLLNTSTITIWKQVYMYQYILSKTTTNGQWTIYYNDCFPLYEEFGIHRGLITEKFLLFFRVHARKCQRNQLMRICEHYGLKTPASRLLLYCYTFTMYNVDYKTGCKISSDNGIIATG